MEALDRRSSNKAEDLSPGQEPNTAILSLIVLILLCTLAAGCCTGEHNNPSHQIQGQRQAAMISTNVSLDLHAIISHKGWKGCSNPKQKHSESTLEVSHYGVREYVQKRQTSYTKSPQGHASTAPTSCLISGYPVWEAPYVVIRLQQTCNSTCHSFVKRQKNISFFYFTTDLTDHKCNLIWNKFIFKWNLTQWEYNWRGFFAQVFLLTNTGASSFPAWDLGSILNWKHDCIDTT